MHILIGLGNPGKQYEYTRHNIGALFLSYLQKEYGFSDWQMQKKFQALTAEGEIRGSRVLLVFPQTFMNASGASLSALLRYTKVESITVVTDDKDMEFGKTRWRKSGSAGGHNGLKDMFAVLGHNTLSRLKIGVATPLLQRMNTADFVLSSFSSQEREMFGSIFSEAEELLLQESAIGK